MLIANVYVIFKNEIFENGRLSGVMYSSFGHGR